MWRRARRKAGCDGMHLHHLRHFYASGLIAAGCDVVTVQRALGHRTASVTLNTYSHLWPSAEDKTRAAAAGMMAETLNGADSVRTGGGGRAATCRNAADRQLMSNSLPSGSLSATA